MQQHESTRVRETADNEQDPLASVRDPDGTLNRLAIGEAEQAYRNRTATPEMIEVLDHLHAHEMSFLVLMAFRDQERLLMEEAREQGGTIITTRRKMRDGRFVVATTVRRFAAPKASTASPRPRRARSRAGGRRRVRCTRSARASGDSGDDEAHHHEPFVVPRPAETPVFLCSLAVGA